MKKAVIQSGSKQYVVAVGDTIDVELIKDAGASVSFEPLLVIEDDGTVRIGAPNVAKVNVTAEVMAANKQADKVTSIRYKAKKRVHKTHGHRQNLSVIQISSIKTKP